MTKHPVHHITDTLTAESICEKLGVGRHSIRYARTEGSFPASWYGPLKAMCDEVGIPCPLSAFNWKTSAKNIGPFHTPEAVNRSAQAGLSQKAGRQ